MTSTNAPAPPSTTAPAVSDAALRKAAAGVNHLAATLYARLAATPGDVFFSPFSIETALAMTGAGAAGSTAAEMSAVLGVDVQHRAVHDAVGGLARAVTAGQEVEIRVANRTYVKDGLRVQDGFNAIAREAYGASSQSVDFTDPATRIVVNDWVADQTNQKIKDLIPDGALKDAAMVLVNAIYFFGTWARPFPEAATKDEPFYAAGGARTVRMMHGGGELEIADLGDAHLVVLPYAGGTFAMKLVVPKEKDGLAGVEARLSTIKWSGATRDVALAMPRFKLTQSVALSKVLRAMGMPLAFGDAADFSRLTNVDLKISEVFHKAFVDVTEKGTEAAAATAVVMAPKGAPMAPFTLRADRPFLFAITEVKTGAILFMGRLANP